MLKNISQLEFAIENKSYRFQCEIDSPLHHIKEALFQIQKYVGQVEDNIKLQEEQSRKSPQPVVSPEDEHFKE